MRQHCEYSNWIQNLIEFNSKFNCMVLHPLLEILNIWDVVSLQITCLGGWGHTKLVQMRLCWKFIWNIVFMVFDLFKIRRCNKLANYTSEKLRAAKLICLGASSCQGLISIHPPSCLPPSPCSPPFLHLHLHLCLHLRTKENICRLVTVCK